MCEVKSYLLYAIMPGVLDVGSNVVLLDELQRRLHVARLGCVHYIGRVEAELTTLLSSIWVPANACPVRIDGIAAVVGEHLLIDTCRVR